MSEKTLETGLYVIPLNAEDISSDTIRTYSYTDRKTQKIVEVPYYPIFEVLRFFRKTFGIGVDIVDRENRSGIVRIQIPAVGSRPATEIMSYIRAFRMQYRTIENGKIEEHVIDFEGAAEIKNGNVADAAHAAASNAFKELIKFFGFGLDIFDKYDSTNISSDDDIISGFQTPTAIKGF
jgi:hypothetical protein